MLCVGSVVAGRVALAAPEASQEVREATRRSRHRQGLTRDGQRQLPHDLESASRRDRSLGRRLSGRRDGDEPLVRERGKRARTSLRERGRERRAQRSRQVALFDRSYGKEGKRGRFVDDVFYGRKLRVYLPSDYDPHGSKHYPVLYLADGQDVFEDANEPGQRADFWRVDDVLDRMTQAGEIRDAIVVAIWHQGTGNGRIDEYANSSRTFQPPWEDHVVTIGGAADQHLEFVADRVKPWIDEHFATDRRAEATTLGGSSMGGRFALYGALRRPERFGGALVMSPSLSWNGGDMVKWIEGAERLQDLAATEEGRARKRPPRIYLDSGGYDAAGERGSFDERDETDQLKKHLESRRDASGTLVYEHERTLRHRYADDDAHDQFAWRRRLPDALRFFLGRPERRR